MTLAGVMLGLTLLAGQPEVASLFDSYGLRILCDSSMPELKAF